MKISAYDRSILSVCEALTIMLYKVPSVTDTRDINEDGEWWTAELRDKGIPIRWDKKDGKFIPEDTNDEE